MSRNCGTIIKSGEVCGQVCMQCFHILFVTCIKYLVIESNFPFYNQLMQGLSQTCTTLAFPLHLLWHYFWKYSKVVLRIIHIFRPLFLLQIKARIMTMLGSGIQRKHKITHKEYLWINSAMLVKLNTTISLVHIQTGISTVWAVFVYLHWSHKHESWSKTGNELSSEELGLGNSSIAFPNGIHWPLVHIPQEFLRWEK